MAISKTKSSDIGFGGAMAGPRHRCKRLLPHFNFVRGILAALLVGSERLREQSVSA